MEDDWTRLFAAVEGLTKGKLGHVDVKWHPMKFAALKAFALVARARGWQPRDIGLVEAQQLEEEFCGNKRHANRQALNRLDELRQFPELLTLLPPQPIGFCAQSRVPQRPPLDPQWERQIAIWVDKVTKGGWDPVSQTHTDVHKGHAHVITAALRTILRIAVETGLLAPDTSDLTPLLRDEAALCTIVRELLDRRLRSKQDGHLDPRTSRKYLKVLIQLQGHLGIDTALLKQVLANNQVAREGKKADNGMTKTNRVFCEALLTDQTLRRRFLLSFRTLRDAAEVLQEQAEQDGRPLTPREHSRVRMLGTCACFAAIEIGGAPIRVTNAMQLVCVGEDAQIRIPSNRSSPIKVQIPSEKTKNRTPIEFPIRPGAHEYHDTIMWYFHVIRPLFPHARTSPYLFPAVKDPGKPLNAGYFGAEFSTRMRTVANFPMTPHQMRHGQTSLLLDRYPQEIEVIAKRIDDTAATLRQYYGWLNALKLVERGQDMMIGLMDD